MPTRQATWPATAHQGSEPSSPPLFPASELDLRFRPGMIRSQTRVLDLLPRHQASTVMTITPDVTPEGVAAWRAKIAKASERERRMFLQYEAADLKQYTTAIEKTVLKHGKDSLALRVAHSLEPLFKTMNMYAPIAQTMIQADPTSSSLILGGITCVMAISSRFLDYQEKTAEMLASMLKRLDILLKYGENIYKNNSQMQRAIMEVYGDVLDFCVQASRLFLDDKGKPRSSFKTFLTSLGKSFEAKFSEVLTKFTKDIKEFEEAAIYVDRERGEADRRIKEVDRAVDYQFMEHQVFQGNRIHRDVLSVGQQMMITSQRQQEEMMNRRAEALRIRGEKRQKVIAWLPSIPFHKDQVDKYHKRLDGTGQWLLDNKTFQDWKDSSASELLWVHGKHGCGKSYLAARVIHDLAETTQIVKKDTMHPKDPVALAYIYCNSLEATKIDPSKLIGSLLNQLCHLLPLPEIEPFLESLHDRQTEPPARQDMQRAIGLIMARFSRTYIVVDGLDECHKVEDSQFEDLCQFVLSLAQPKAMGSVAKVLVFSRPEYPAIEDAFANCLKIQVDNSANDDDIKQFISKKVSGKELHLSKNSGIIEEVEGTLLSGADGMFLWVDLLVKTLEGSRTTKEMKAKLKRLPQKLEDVYELSMLRVLDQDEFVRTRALKILLWTTNAARALSREELREALAIESNVTEIDEESKISDDAGFAAECGDMVVLINGHYHLIHSSLKDYLGKLPMSKSDLLEEYGLMQKDASRVLGEACLTYLLFDAFKKGPMEDKDRFEKVHEESPFLQYAATFWGRHVADTKGTSLLELTETFLTSKEARELSMQVFMQQQGASVFPYPETTTPLHLLSLFNLAEIAVRFPNAPLMRRTCDGFNFTPLEYALTRDSREICNWILDCDINLPSVPGNLHSQRAPVHLAAMNDWAETIERLITLSYDPEAKSGDRGQTPLNHAASDGCESALIALLKAKVDVNSADNDGTTPLIDAADSNHTRLVTLLIEAGADVNVQGWNNTAALHHAAVHGELGTAKALLEKGAQVDPVTGDGWGYRTPLHLATEKGHLEVVELLIGKGADVNKHGPNGYTPLILSCSSGFPACFRRLLQAKAEIDKRNETDQTCFHLAAMNGYSEIVEILVEICPNPSLINSVDDQGDTPLHSAVWQGKEAQAKLLLEKGAATNVLNKNHHTPLHAAIMEGLIVTTEILVRDYGADVMQKGFLGSPALHYAANYGRCGFIPFILGAGADPAFENDNKNTAVHFATKGNSLEFIKKFVEAVPTLDLAPKNETGQTPLHMAASGGYLDIVKFFLDGETTSVQVEDNFKSLPLHFAAWGGHLEVLKVLVDDNNINAQGQNGRTPLFAASGSGHLELVKALLERHADLNAVDNYNQTPLFAAVANKHLAVANLLLDHHADPRIPSKYGETALHLAQEIGDEKIVRKLLAEKCDGLILSVWGVTPFLRAVYSGKVELVEAFMEFGFDGTTVPDKTGSTSLHYAAESGSLKMLEKLTTNNKEIALVVDVIGRDCMDYAMGKGQIEMIEPLMTLGIGVKGSGKGPKFPLKTAAGNGFPDCVSRLIELGADLGRQAGSEEWTALHIATAHRKPLVTAKLVEAGADVDVRDAFGLSPLDYAIRDPQVWEKMGDAKRHHVPVQLQERIPKLKKTVQKCIQAILAHPEEGDAESEYERLTHLDTLADALNEMGTDHSRESARVCRTEQACPAEVSIYSTTWTCEMCYRTPLRGIRYYCLQCDSCHLCSLCYPDYVKGDETPLSAPQSLKVLRQLESSVKPIRELAKAFPVFGAGFVYSTCDNLVVVSEWVDAKLKEYEEWEKKYNKTNRFDSFKRPGQMLLKIIVKIRKWAEDPNTGGGDSGKEFVTKVEEEIVELYRMHKPDEEISNFICSGHIYSEIRDKDSLQDADKKHFGADGRIQTEWLLALLEKYGDPVAEISDEKTVEGDQMLSSQVDSEPVTDRITEAEVVDQMSILTPVLTDEPEEITSTADPTTVSTADTSYSARSTIKPITDTEIIKIPHPNRQRLLAIREILSKQMMDAIEEARAKKALIEAARLGRQVNDQLLQDLEDGSKDHSDGKNIPGEGQATIENHSVKNNDIHPIKTEDNSKQDESSASGDTSSNVKEEENKDSDDDETLLAIFALQVALNERELAWQFAQIILFGSVVDCLVEDFVDNATTKTSNGETLEQGKIEESVKEDGQILPATDANDSKPAEAVGTELRQTSSESENTQKDEADTFRDESGVENADEKNNEENQPQVLRQVEKAQVKEVSELRQSLEGAATPHDRFKAYRQASIDSLPPSPLSRKNTDLLTKLV